MDIFKINKKGQQAVQGPLMGLLVAGVLMVVILLVFSFSAKILSDVGNSFTAGTVERGITANGTQVLTTLASNSNTIALVVVAVVIMTLLLGVLAIFTFGRR